MSRAGSAAATVIVAIVGILWVQTNFAGNERLTDSAPQQTVAALWAIKDLLTLIVVLLIGVVWTMSRSQEAKTAAAVEPAQGKHTDTESSGTNSEPTPTNP